MKVTVRLPGALRDIAGAPAAVPLDLPPGATVGDALAALAGALPAVGRRVRDETGALRPHVNVFVGSDNIRDLAGTATPLDDGAELHVLPAVSGG
ncbi:ubiquitin-like small modifier protein 1 [Actinomadura rupiterrae]|uniref:ubiquitin-like small modifier protein 1 n=1 Tax=Actinomadura rupiterrae TaxID=559627 RepID=UPI0020A4B50F|nr:ubiquitin-like small modifier protein 1 [Actinomadura rupiterrae]MCP2342317.1 molybdopterin converting factor small subunit [Actinomadura rupiterrae]